MAAAVEEARRPQQRVPAAAAPVGSAGSLFARVQMLASRPRHGACQVEV